MNRRAWVSSAVDAVMSHWLGGITPENGPASEDLAEWWASDEGADAALELVHLVGQAIEEAGFDIVERGSTS